MERQDLCLCSLLPTSVVDTINRKESGSCDRIEHRQPPHIIMNAVLVVYGVTDDFKSRECLQDSLYKIVANFQKTDKLFMCNMQTYIEGQSFICTNRSCTYCKSGGRDITLHTNDVWYDRGVRMIG
jgi:hypothetical protein